MNIVVTHHAKDRWLQRVTIKNGLPREDILKALEKSQRLADQDGMQRYFHRITKTVFFVAEKPDGRKVLVTVVPARKDVLKEADAKPKLTEEQKRNGLKLCAICQKPFVPNYQTRPQGLKACSPCVSVLKEQEKAKRKEKKRSLV